MRVVSTKLNNGDFEKLASACSEKGITVSEQLRRLIFSNFDINDLTKPTIESKINSDKLPITISLIKNLIKFKEYEIEKLNQLTKNLPDDKTNSSLKDNLKRISNVNQDVNALRIIGNQLESF